MICKDCGNPVYPKGVTFIGPCCHCGNPTVLR